MTDTNDTLGRLTLDTLDRSTTIPHFEIERADARMLVAPAALGTIAGFLLGRTVGMPLLGPLFGAVGFVVGIGLLLAKPSHMTATTYTQSLLEHVRVPQRFQDTPVDEPTSTDEASVVEEVRPDQSTREHTHIERYYPDQGVLERTDGQFVAALELEPHSMDFAEIDEWIAVGRRLEEFAKNDLSFPVQVFATTREFPVEDHLDDLAERIDDPAIESTPAMESVLDDHVESRRERLATQTVAPPHYYVVVSVDQADVLTDEATDDAGLEVFTDIPVVGIAAELLLSKQADVDDDELHHQMFQVLHRRLSVIESSWIQELDGAAGRRLPTSELLELVRQTWLDESRAPVPVRDHPVVVGDVVQDRSGAERETGPGESGAESAADDEAASDDAGEADEAGGLAELHQRQVAPESVDREWDVVQVGDQYKQVLYVDAFPDTVQWGALRSLFTRPDIEFDLGMHLTPLDRRDAMRDAENRYQSLETGASTSHDEIAATDKLDKADRTELVRKAMKQGQRPFEVSLYVVTRGEDEDSVRAATRTVRSTLQDAPADMAPKTLRGQDQLRGLASTTPIGHDVVATEGNVDPASVTLARGIGALLASIKDSTLLEEGGIELGSHAYNGTPVIKQQFETETNFNWVVIGDSGSGKSYFSKQTAVRTWMQRDDTQIVFIDPLRNFEGVAHALDARTIRVGGGQSLNPMEIQPTTTYTDTEDENVDPLTEKIKDVLSFFDNYAHQQGLDRGLGEARPVLSVAIKEAYNRRGITHDIETHSTQSPTIQDVMGILAEMADSPENFVLRSERETEDLERYAAQLLNLLRPFETGQYENLAQPSEFELGDDDVVYLDLSQSEGSEDGGGGLMMQLIFSLVYERAKTTSDNVIIYIDEARYFMRNSKNLKFLGQRVRHSRHYNTSIRFITQNINDFFSHEEAESIINNAAFTTLLNTDEIAEWQETFGLNDREVRFVQDAQTGQKGYSEALLDIDGQRYPIQIQSTPLEHEIIDFEIETDDLASLPGFGEETPQIVRELRSVLEQQAAQYRQDLSADERDAFVKAWNSLSTDAQQYTGLLTDTELYRLLESIANSSTDPDVLLGEALESKVQALFDQGLVDTRRVAQMFDEEVDPSVATTDPEALAVRNETEPGSAEPDEESTAVLQDTSMIDDSLEAAAEGTGRFDGTVEVPDCRQDVFERAIEIDRSDRSRPEKEDGLNELVRKALLADLEIDAANVRRAIQLDREATREELPLSTKDVVLAVDNDLSIEDIKTMLECGTGSGSVELQEASVDDLLGGVPVENGHTENGSPT